MSLNGHSQWGSLSYLEQQANFKTMAYVLPARLKTIFNKGEK